MKPTRPLRLTLALLPVALGLALAPRPAAAAGLTVTGAWARATPPGATAGAAYLVLRNDTGSAEPLTSAECDRADSVMAHVTRLVDGVESMHDEPLIVPAHASLTLAPQGSHLMLMGLKGPLVRGSTLTLTLHFAHAGTLTVRVPVLAATATAAP